MNNINAAIIRVPCPNNQFDYDAFDSRFYYIGIFHNQSLSNLISVFRANQSINDYEIAVNYLRDVNKSFYNSSERTYFGSTLSSQFTDDEFEKSKYYTNRIDFENKLLLSNSPISLDSCIIKINSIPTIDNNNKQLFSDITNLIRSSLNREISDSEFEESLVNLSNNWLQINSSNNQTFGARLTGYVLTIGLKSCEWWRQNLNELDDGNDNTIALIEISNSYPMMERSGPNLNQDKVNTLYVLPAVVATDIAGAFIGTTLNTIQQWHDKGLGNINMDQVYRSAAIGAVTGSTGLAGRVGKWLRSIF